MNIGLLWYDDDAARTLEQKVARAAARYREKRGVPPDTCFVHPKAMAAREGTLLVDGVRVLGAANILPHHFWLGRNDDVAAVSN